MVMPRFFSLLLASGLALSPGLSAQEGQLLETWAEALYGESEDGQFALQGGGSFTGWLYYADDEGGPPGFWFPSDDGWVEAARLTLTADAFYGEKVYGFVKFRFDSGVHPGVGPAAYNRDREFRFDEFFLRAQLTDDPTATVQVGQFAPLFGGFLGRQGDWESALINYPLTYENVTSISDAGVAPNATAFAARRQLSDGPRKVIWNSAIWAPAYLRGAAVFGAVGDFDYAVNLMNAAPSSRGLLWDDNDWGHPTTYLRLGYAPSAAWHIGVNASHGPYFRPHLAARLPAGTNVDDFQQLLLGLEAKWVWRRWEVWGELWRVRFDVPNVDDDAVYWTGFIEGRYQLNARWWLAARWNAETYEQIRTENGREDWDNDVYRLDVGLGWRWSRHAQLKAQYSFQEQDATFQNGRHFAVVELTIRL